MQTLLDYRPEATVLTEIFEKGTGGVSDPEDPRLRLMEHKATNATTPAAARQGSRILWGSSSI